MDPVASLSAQRAAAAQIEVIRDRCSDDGTFQPADVEKLQDLALELSELVEALDEWRTKGGFDPYLPFVPADSIDGLEVTEYESARDGAAVVEIAYAGHLRVIVGEQSVFDGDAD